jgi:hypothetical protein
MSKKNTASVSPVTPPVDIPKPKLTEEQIAFAATNDPAMSQNEFQLNGKTYKYVHLSYDYYLEFMLKIKPLLAAVVGTVAAKDHSTVTLPGIELTQNPLGGIIQFCGTEIPDMVRIVINNSLEAGGRASERVTIADIKTVRGITPMQLANIVMGQVLFNNMIAEFGSFFVQAMPLLKAMGILTQPKVQ